MGQCQARGELDSGLRISRSDFDFVKPIGRGALGTVWKVKHKQSHCEFAIKEFVKDNIPSKEALCSILNERGLLSILFNPFIVNLNFAFQDKKKLYLGLDIKLGGDLRYHMIRRKFNEQEFKFIFASLLQALEYIHSKSVIHKDIKPENIIFDNRGYVFLTDFGTASMIKPENYFETSGTPGYMAPEVICRQNHSFCSDYFPLGVILYEVIMGKRPYIGKSRKQIRELMLETAIKLTPESASENWSVESLDLCNKLLKRKPSSRIGYNGTKEILSHRWLTDIDVEKLKNFELKPPFVPIGNENYDHEYVLRYKFNPKKKLASCSNDFAGYFYSPAIRQAQQPTIS